jgi:hypothetical protein
MRDFDNRPEELFAYFRREDQANSKLAIFVHGFFGSYLSTWGALPDLLHKNSDTPTSAFSDWDYVFLGYKTRAIRGYLDISDLLLTHMRNALSGNGPYGQPYDDFSLFGHSLGTLGIRQFLCTSSFHDVQLVRKVRSVTLFGSPGKGSPLAPIAAPFVEVGHALKPGNPQLRMLAEWTACAHSQGSWPPPLLVMGKGDKVVGPDAIQFAGDNEKIESTSFGHFALVKPRSWKKSGVVEIISKALA